MKKILLFSSVLMLSMMNSSAQTATNFTANDCAGNSHTLFSELDGGKVIVVSFVMPCGSCIGPSQTAYNCVQGFASSNPGRVLFYIADDAGTTACSTINSWATTNSMPNSTRFSNTGFVESSYGSGGMPKIIVLGGTAHTVFYNANGSSAGNASGINSAITSALNATTGITESKGELNSLNVFPNPANTSSIISYSLESASDVSINIFNLFGEKVQTAFSGKLSAGEHTSNVDCSQLRNGLYFLKVSSGKLEKTLTLSVSH